MSDLKSILKTNSKPNITVITNTNNNTFKNKFTSKISPKKKKRAKNITLSDIKEAATYKDFIKNSSPQIKEKKFQNDSKKNYYDFLHQIKNKVNLSYEKYSYLNYLKDKDIDLVFEGAFNDLIDTFQLDDKELNIIEFDQENNDNNKKKLTKDLYDKSGIADILSTVRGTSSDALNELIINDKYNITYSTFLEYLNNLETLDEQNQIKPESEKHLTVEQYLRTKNIDLGDYTKSDKIFITIRQRIWEKVYQDILIRGTTEKMCIPHNMHIEISPELSYIKKFIDTNIIYAGYPSKKNNTSYKQNINKHSKYFDYGMIENVLDSFGLFLIIRLFARKKDIWSKNFTKKLLSKSDPKNILSLMKKLNIKLNMLTEKEQGSLKLLDQMYLKYMDMINNFYSNDKQKSATIENYRKMFWKIRNLKFHWVTFSINLIKNYGNITYINPIIKNNDNSDIEFKDIGRFYTKLVNKYEGKSSDSEFIRDLNQESGNKNKLYLKIIEEINPNNELDKPYYSTYQYTNIHNEWINIKKKNKLIQHFRYDMNHYPHVTIKYVLDTCLKDKEMKKEYSNGILIPMNVFTGDCKSDGLLNMSKPPTIDIASYQDILKGINHANILIFDTRNNQEIKVYIFDMNNSQPPYIKKNIDKYLKMVENKVKEEKGNYKFHRNNIKIWWTCQFHRNRGAAACQ